MPDAGSTIDELKQRGAGRPAPEDVARLWRLAFAEFGARALWNWRRDIERPSIAQALAIAEALRSEGDLAARRLAERIEQACRAAI